MAAENKDPLVSQMAALTVAAKPPAPVPAGPATAPLQPTNQYGSVRYTRAHFFVNRNAATAAPLPTASVGTLATVNKAPAQPLAPVLPSVEAPAYYAVLRGRVPGVYSQKSDYLKQVCDPSLMWSQLTLSCLPGGGSSNCERSRVWYAAGEPQATLSPRVLFLLN
jgi:hypothetical protein